MPSRRRAVPGAICEPARPPANSDGLPTRRTRQAPSLQQVEKADSFGPPSRPRREQTRLPDGFCDFFDFCIHRRLVGGELLVLRGQFIDQGEDRWRNFPGGLNHECWRTDGVLSRDRLRRSQAEQNHCSGDCQKIKRVGLHERNSTRIPPFRIVKAKKRLKK